MRQAFGPNQRLRRAGELRRTRREVEIAAGVMEGQTLPVEKDFTAAILILPKGPKLLGGGMTIKVQVGPVENMPIPHIFNDLPSGLGIGLPHQLVVREEALD